MFQVTEEKKNKDQESRRSYNAPHLIVFGALRDLTAGGSGTLQETGGGPPKPPPGQGGGRPDPPPGQGGGPTNPPPNPTNRYP